MRFRSLEAVVVALIALALCGCGGISLPGGSGEYSDGALDVIPTSLTDPVSPTATDADLTGMWLVLHAKRDGVDAAPAEVEHWPESTARHVVQFSLDGGFVQTWFNLGGGAVASQQGIWSSEGNLATIVAGGETQTLRYSVNGNVLLASYADEGHAIVLRLVKIVPLSEHDPALVGTWKTSAVWLNGVAKPLSYLAGDTTFKLFARSFLAEGDSQRYRLKGAHVRLPKQPVQTWASGGGEVRYGPGQWNGALYCFDGDRLYLWQLDDNGNTVKIMLRHYGAEGGHDPALIGVWHPVSALVDGQPTPLADFFHWEGGQDGMRFTFWGDGTAEEEDLAGTTLLRANLDTWYTSGNHLYLHMPGDGPSNMTYDPAQTHLTVLWTQEGHQMVLTMAR